MDMGSYDIDILPMIFWKGFQSTDSSVDASLVYRQLFDHVRMVGMNAIPIQLLGPFGAVHVSVKWVLRAYALHDQCPKS